MKPTFLFIGPDKTGSTWMYELLRAHPQVFVPHVKDLYFFDRHYERGWRWYLNFFATAPHDTRAAGELSHDYFFSSAAMGRIARHLPRVRLLTCLRDPTSRTLSHYLYMVRSGRTREPLENALDTFPELVEHSHYARHLGRWFDRFGRACIRVLWFEHLEEDPKAFGQELLEFLEVPALETLPYGRRVLAAARPRSHAVARLARLGARAMRRMGLPGVVGAVKRHPMPQKLLYETYKRAEKPRLELTTRRRLVERFRPDVRALEELLDVDLGHWLEVR